MKNNESFNYDELSTIYRALHDSMTLISKEEDFTEEDKEWLINNIRNVAYKVAKKMEALEDGNSN